MPFTPAHAVAVMPLRKIRALPSLALIVGSVAPDGPYFMPRPLSSLLPNTHALPGSVTVAPLCGMVVLMLLRLLRRPLAAPLWGVHRHLVAGWLDDFGSRSADWLWAVPAVYVGVMTHVVWDSFTHDYGWSAQHWPVFQSVLFQIGPRPFAVFRILQWLSSIVGLMILAHLYRNAVTQADSLQFSDKGRKPALLGLLAIFGISGAVGLVRATVMYSRYHYLDGGLFVGLIAMMATFAIGYLALGFARARNGI